MAAPSNENQGLKIAVACFVMLSVILAVSTYFGFKYYLESDKRLTDSQVSAAAEKKEQERLTRAINDFNDVVGFLKTTEPDALGKVAKQEIEELVKKAVTIRDESIKALDEYKAAGGAQSKLDEERQSLDAIIAGLNDPARTLKSVSNRYAELLKNQAIISTMLAAEFHSTRNDLADTNKINQSKLDIEISARQGIKVDQEAEIKKHETDRQTLGAKVSVLQEDTNRQATEINKLTAQIAQMQDDHNKQRESMLVNIRDFRDRLAKTDVILDKKDGVITFVDYTLGEVRTDLKRSQGAREQMVLTIFDRKAPGLPSDHPKGSIELIQVGENGSLGRIIETKIASEPFRVGDQVYSPSWDPNRPQQFALIGKMDINQDGRDDREDLKRMIKNSGGIVAYDLPPSSIGKETGKLSPAIAWYVIDDRDSFHPSTARESVAVSGEEQAFLAKRTDAIKTARLDGILPLPIERLLSRLGQSYTTPVSPGRVEAINKSGVYQLTNPKGKVGSIPPPEEEKPPAEEPK